MINLLPPDVKSDYRYARLNVGSRRWIILCLLAFVGLGIITTYGLVSLHRSTVDYDHRVATTETLFKQENFSGTQQQVQDISSSFKLVVKVLGQEVLFSELLKQIAASIPANANLTSLNINQSQAAIDITANATDYNTATQVQVNLADSRNKIFSKADIVNVSCGASATNPRYPCTVNIRALFAGNNPFLFINSKAAAP
jgi:Tfp pilus assembly protein PilN